jgi:hypothetical protein
VIQTAVTALNERIKTVWPLNEVLSFFLILWKFI